MRKIELPEEKELEIITFYLTPNNEFTTVKAFNINNRILHRIFDKYNVQKHSKGVKAKLLVDKQRATFLERYNVENPSQLEEVKLKKQETCQINFGVAWPGQSNLVQEKSKATCMQHFGVEYSLQAPSVREKCRQTNLNNFGVENPAQCRQVKEKMKNTCIEKYGTANIAEIPGVKQKKEQTCLARYGVNSYMKTDTFRQRSLEATNSRPNRYKVGTEHFDSFPELCFYLYHKHNNDNIKRNKAGLPYIFENKTHYYFPDFSINDILYEIKGAHFIKDDGTWQCPYDHLQDDKAEAKHQCAVTNGVIILSNKEYQKYIDWFYNSSLKKEDFRINRSEKTK